MQINMIRSDKVYQEMLELPLEKIPYEKNLLFK